MPHHLVTRRHAPHDIYIGRPSKWGNPFIIGRDGTREEVVAKYEAWLTGRPELMAALPELRGMRPRARSMHLHRRNAQ